MDPSELTCEACGRRVTGGKIRRAFHRCLTRRQRRSIDKLELSIVTTSAAVLLEGSAEEHRDALEALADIRETFAKMNAPLPPSTEAKISKAEQIIRRAESRM